MSTASVPAKYDANRKPNGHFAPKNRAGTSWSSETATKFKQAQAAWLDAVDAADMIRVAEELKWLCLQREDLKVKQAAIVYFLDRQLGKPVERLDVSASDSGPAPILNLRPDQLAVLEELVVQTAGPEVFVVEGE